MRIKSYFVNRVANAMELARLELGDEAVFLESRPTTGEAMLLGKYEVVFGTAAPVMAAASKAPARQAAVAFAEEPDDELLLRAAESVTDSAPLRTPGRAAVPVNGLRLESTVASRRESFKFVPG